MMIFAAVAVSWCLVMMITVILRRLENICAPHVLLHMLGIGSVLLAVTTMTALAAALCAYSPHGAGNWPSVTAAATISAYVLSRVASHGIRVISSIRSCRVFSRASTRDGDMVVVPDEQPEAFAVPGRDGLIVVTTALRDALTAEELAAVLRHERAHIRGRHQWWIQMVEVAACLNPVLHSWRRAARFAAERHADEQAAAPDRAVAARTLTKVALLRSQANRRPWTALGVVESVDTVVARIRALQQPQPRRRHRVVLAAAMLLALLTAVDLEVTADMVQDRLAPESGEAASIIVG